MIPKETDESILLVMTSTLRELATRLDGEERRAAVAVIKDFIEQLKVYIEQGATLAECSAILHRAVDAFLREGQIQSRNTAQSIRCVETCAHCCHLPVAIATCEAEELVAVAVAKGLVLDRSRLTRQASWQTDEEWVVHGAEERRCVFLGPDRRCQVYEHRPLSCRKYFSTSPPDLCDTDRYPKQSIAIWFDMYAELLTTAAMTHFDVGYLPQLVLRVLSAKTKEAHDGI